MRSGMWLELCHEVLQTLNSNIAKAVTGRANSKCESKKKKLVGSKSKGRKLIVPVIKKLWLRFCTRPISSANINYELALFLIFSLYKKEKIILVVVEAQFVYD